MIKKLDEKDIESLTKAIATSKDNIKVFQWDIETKQAMLDKGLDINYLVTKKRLETELKQRQSELAFEEKVIKQYEEVLEKGEMEMPDANEETEQTE